MTMSTPIIDFLQRNKELINNCDFVTLGEKAYKQLSHEDYANIFYILLEANLNPLSKFEAVPIYFLYENKDIQQIELPNHLKAIRNYAFYDCKNLKQINIPENIEAINGDAF